MNPHFSAIHRCSWQMAAASFKMLWAEEIPKKVYADAGSGASAEVAVVVYYTHTIPCKQHAAYYR